MRPFLQMALSVLLACASGAFAQSGKPRAQAAAVTFNRDILPILAQNCFICHGPSEQKAGLRLDQRASALKATRSGATPIVPGKPADSELVRRIFSDDSSDRMPPPKSKKSLTAAQKEILKQWIAQGAEFKTHWAFVKPERPALPKVKNRAWVHNEIDAFVLAELEKAGLEPSPAADRPTLIRRLSFDLRGLPPTPEELDRFLNDKNPDAYEKLVDRMLASPRYGEKMAQIWLDLARYGDTSGFHFDSTRQMWLWRDWVINAFNANTPFDQFTIEQIAGDLLPKPTVAQKIATGFQRNSRFNEEGGVDPEEFVVRYNVDRTNTLGQVWLGLTLGCAECHDHMYDPISQKEYYQLFAFFTGIKEPMKSGNHNEPLPPLLKLPTPEQAKTIEVLDKTKARLEERIQLELARIKYKDPLEDKPEALKPPTEGADVVWLDDAPPQGAKTGFQGEAGWQWVTAPDHPVFSGRRAVYRSGSGVHNDFFTNADVQLEIEAGDKLFCYVWLDPTDPPKHLLLQFNDGSWDHRVYWGPEIKDLAPKTQGQAAGPANAGPFHAGPLPEKGEWVRLEVEAEKVALKPGAKLAGWAFGLIDGAAYFDHAGVYTRFPPDERVETSAAFWEQRIRATQKIPKELAAIVNVAAAKRSTEQKKTLQHYFLRKVYAPARAVFEPLEKELEEAVKKLKETEEAIPHTLIAEEMPEARPAYVLIRGDFQQKGDQVGRDVPALFPPLYKHQPKNRLGLARWLMQTDHPLTARVAVNRLWAQMFGSGLVRTLGDFGSQGDFPSHPELLDWLAVEFADSGWNVKAILRKLALSKAYRQSSAIAPLALQARGVGGEGIDPSNRLLWRAHRYRLSAEEIRDNALAIAGLLSDKVGGPSVMPHQPPDFYKGKREDWTWKLSTGEDQYRRGLYTFWRRTTLHPMFAIFDAPTREECAVARPRTNTALQALVTLNDPTFVEAARVFAERILSQGPRDIDGRLTYAYRVALCRPPSADEIKVLTAHLAKQTKHFQENREAASKLVQFGNYPRLANLDEVEHAAWTAVASMILNLDETITRE
ncbi:MAG: PSD1 and planctomycete cytochrome C domain-containing protein [Gemmataceae bacterium]|nr:PSD1 and planctomycete cytochrome C domain-containing protein [Gemmataceae bacterium]